MRTRPSGSLLVMAVISLGIAGLAAMRGLFFSPIFWLPLSIGIMTLAGIAYASPRLRGEPVVIDAAKAKTDKPKTAEMGGVMFSHAAAAMIRADQDPDTMRMLVTDIGLLTVGEGQRPLAYRDDPLPTSVPALLPFVELETRVRSSGKLRFKVSDEQGTVRYQCEQSESLPSGRLQIQALTSFQITEGRTLDVPWSLKIYADDVLLADHQFTWHESVMRNNTQPSDDGSARFEDLLRGSDDPRNTH